MLQLSMSFDKASVEVANLFKQTDSDVHILAFRHLGASFVRWLLTKLLLPTAYGQFRPSVFETYAREVVCTNSLPRARLHFNHLLVHKR
jgi:hypothetical protein